MTPSSHYTDSYYHSHHSHYRHHRSHHQRQKQRQRVRLVLKIILGIIAPFFLFFGVGELFQGSLVMGVVILLLGAVSLFLTISIKVTKKHW
jgi:hypothetical protein